MARHAGNALVRGSLVVVSGRTDRRRVGIRVARQQAFLLEPDGSAVAGILFAGEVAPE